MKNGFFPRRPGAVVTILVYATVVGACGDSSAPAVPAAVEVVAGAGQSAPAGSRLAISPSVKVVTSSGKGVAGVKVTFVAGPESGVVIGGAQVTDGTGVATATSWTLGTKAGPSTLTVTAEGVAPVTITATTEAGPPVAAGALAGDAQTAMVGTAITTNPAVRVIDNHGNPVPAVLVSFSTQNGSVESTQAQTDANGVASPGKWTLGTVAGTQILVASFGTSVAPITFTATAQPEAAARIAIAREPGTTSGSGQILSSQPIVEFRDRYNNLATSTSLPVTAALAAGSGTLAGTTTVNAQGGRATFTNLAYTGTGTAQLRFSAPGFQDETSSVFAIAAAAPCPGPALTLNYSIGQSARFIGTNTAMPRCLNFSAATNAGQQYLVMFENLSPRGSYQNGVFPGFLNDDGQFNVTVETRAASGSQVSAPVARTRQLQQAPSNAVHGWDFGDQRVYEIEPTPVPGGTPTAKVLRNGDWVNANGSMAITVGDTLQVMMEGITRLNISARMQRAIVRFVNADIVIAEDLRIFSGDTTFKRSSGARNTPLAQADMEEIAREYSQYARPMADRVFAGRHNAATTQDPGRPIAIHSLMNADNIWGYTYSDTNYFVWDYWVGSNGSTKTLAQHAQRNADDLFMHEIAHMRHWGMLERSGRTAMRGNRWLVEGFARFSERLPIAMRLLNTPDFSRTQNVTLPFNTQFKNAAGQQTYYFDDVPTYLQASFSMFEGYGASAYIFDYFADQVAQAGGDWWTALSEFVVNAGNETDVNGVINRYLPGVDFGTLFSRARVALYLDDYDTPGLPAWTQYSMYNLRASRPPASNAGFDPRNLFPQIKPGTPYSDARSIGAGGSFGYVIDGVGATGDVRVDLTPSAVANGIVTIVRIK